MRDPKYLIPWDYGTLLSCRILVLTECRGLGLQRGFIGIDRVWGLGGWLERLGFRGLGFRVCIDFWLGWLSTRGHNFDNPPRRGLLAGMHSPLSISKVRVWGL